MSEASSNSWFDPRINSAFFLSLFLQAIIAFIWVGAASQRLSSVESRLNQQAPTTERLARLEGEMGAIRQSLERIENHFNNRVRP
jgi:HAMP domain-containing protein